jgi:DNA modification methylase
MPQLQLPLTAPVASDLPPPTVQPVVAPDPRRHLTALLAGDLDFKGQDSSYGSHNFHAFAAKFPPQLPRLFIRGLTAPGEVVLDPMMGSGTTLIEAHLLDRRAIGFDLDPLAIRQARVKTTRVDPEELAQAGQRIIIRARRWLASPGDPGPLLRRRCTPGAVEFIEYWFLPGTQLQLLALIQEIERLEGGPVRRFLELAFSSVIITKSGGVSMARDLAHSRPHRVLDKVPRDAVEQFEARLRKNIRSLARFPDAGHPLEIREADARRLPLPDSSVDLVLTSPPYANAIDYMRAHKFSLVWFGETMADMTELRARYIGAERTGDLSGAALPASVEAVVEQVAEADPKRGRVLRKYYVDMGTAISEMFRVLRPGRAAVIVVGSSTMRGIDVETHVCLGEIAAAAGFEVVSVAPRNLDRDRRMMPARWGAHRASGIEERMHEECVIGCLKLG